MRIVFAGTPDFACPSLSALVRAGHELLLVVCQPDRPCGRGQRLRAPAVKEGACGLSLPVAQPERIDTPEFRARLEALALDAFVVVAFGQKIPPWLLGLPRYGCINVHASLLPRYRGAAPIQRALMNGETETGVTIMLLDEGWDTGPILARRAVAIDAEDNAGSLHDKLAEAGADLLVEALAGLDAGTLIPVPQDNALATAAPKVKPEECRLDWNRPAVELHNLVRALAPAPLAETFHGTRRLQVIKTQALPEADAAQPGIVTEVRPEGVSVRAGLGTLRLLEVKPANGRAMPAWAYAQGYRLAPGERFS